MLDPNISEARYLSRRIIFGYPLLIEWDGDVMLLRDGVYKALRQAILNCVLPPGQMLREEVLAGQYGVSRSPVRASLLRLEQENLVTVLPRRGYLVKSITTSDVEDILHLRALVEPSCTAAAARADDTAVQALDHFRGFARRDFTKASFVAYNEAFHHSVADLSDNRRMGALVLDLVQQVSRVVRVLIGTLDDEVVRCDCGEHEAIIDALQAHDSDRAFRLAQTHIAETHERIRMALLRRDAAEQTRKAVLEQNEADHSHPHRLSAGVVAVRRE